MSIDIMSLPISWNYMKQFNMKNPPNTMIPRNPKVESEYKEHSRLLKSKGISVHDYIMKTFLKDKNYNFAPNTFPYYLNHIQHWVLWIRPGLTISEKEILDKIERNFNIDSNELVIFKNKSNNQSIKSITHYHIFIQDK